VRARLGRALLLFLVGRPLEGAAHHGPLWATAGGDGRLRGTRADFRLVREGHEKRVGVRGWGGFPCGLGLFAFLRVLAVLVLALRLGVVLLEIPVREARGGRLLAALLRPLLPLALGGRAEALAEEAGGQAREHERGDDGLHGWGAAVGAGPGI